MELRHVHYNSMFALVRSRFQSGTNVVPHVLRAKPMTSLKTFLVRERLERCRQTRSRFQKARICEGYSTREGKRKKVSEEVKQGHADPE